MGGDKGLKTVGGLLKITGRYKELIIGEGGENIAPVPIEDSVKGLCDAVAECMMVGDQRKYNVAIITPKYIETVTAAITKTNSNGKLVPNNAFKIQKFTILPMNFSEEAGQLTPTKKLKRATVEQQYKAMIDHMY